jgi:hypothetical protein
MSPNPPDALLQVTIKFREEGHEKEEIKERLIQYMLKLRSFGREKDEDFILDFYDYLILQRKVGKAR